MGRIHDPMLFMKSAVLIVPNLWLESSCNQELIPTNDVFTTTSRSIKLGRPVIFTRSKITTTSQPLKVVSQSTPRPVIGHRNFEMSSTDCHFSVSWRVS